MKRLLTSLALAASLILTSCSDNGIDDAIFDVAPGFDIYREANTINGLAQDGVSVAFRLAILLEEMEEAGIDFPEDGSALDIDDREGFTFEFAYNGTTYNKKRFLFGSDTYVSIVKEEDTYYVTYNKVGDNYGCATYDSYYRRGTFKIVTDGGMLNTNGAVWSVLIEGDGIYYATYNNSYDLEESMHVWNADATIWGYGEGKFDYSVGDVQAKYTVNDEKEAEWKISNAEFTISDLGSKAYTIENSIDLNQTLDVYGSGFTLSQVKMSYETTSPITYNPASNLYSYSSGTIEAKFTGTIPSDYYVSDTVEVEFLSVGSYVIRYNGYEYYNK